MVISSQVKHVDKKQEDLAIPSCLSDYKARSINFLHFK